MAPRTGIYFSALLATLSCAWAVATTLCAKQPYKFVSLEGGGVKGICYGGSAAALEQAGLLNEVEGYSGSSAGSQAAALLAVGYTGKELTEELVSLDFAELLWGEGRRVLRQPAEKSVYLGINEHLVLASKTSMPSMFQSHF